MMSKPEKAIAEEPVKTTGIDLERLRAARERLGLTQIQLSVAVGLSKGSMSEYERGVKAPTLPTLKRLSALLGVTVDWLLGIAEPEAEGSKDQRFAESGESECLSVGLQDFLADDALIAALEPTAVEVQALKSLRFLGGLTKDGYIALLMVLRTASVEAMRLRIEVKRRSQVPREEPNLEIPEPPEPSELPEPPANH